jgi:hypothetical protein
MTFIIIKYNYITVFINTKHIACIEITNLMKKSYKCLVESCIDIININN